ncbi:hypothetical protein U1Q18_047238 [Sarracenia purpurea var. burkii]
MDTWSRGGERSLSECKIRNTNGSAIKKQEIAVYGFAKRVYSSTMVNGSAKSNHPIIPLKTRCHRNQYSWWFEVRFAYLLIPFFVGVQQEIGIRDAR